MGGKHELLCEDNTCIIEPEILTAVNSEEDKTGWHASNYSEFWGRKLTEGLTLRLGKKFVRISGVAFF